ncbi:MAG: aminopeptidase [Firmicutes bacterium]|nr:aminopeptidase [Bacillota bacterium]
MSQLRVIEAVAVAAKLVRDHLAVKAGEQVLIVCDPSTEMDMAWALAGAVSAAGGEYTLAVMPDRARGRGTELTACLDAALDRADVLIGLTAASGAPTYARSVADRLQNKRLRALSMVMRTMDNWTRGAALADYEELDRLGRSLADMWAAGSQVSIFSPSGTRFSAGVTKEPVMDQIVIVECGIAREPGREAAFSDGEISQRPLPGTASGTLVVDGPVALAGAGDDPIRVEVKNGKVVEVSGGARARWLKQILDEVPGADHVAEIGLGLNPAALRNGDFEEEKKAAGNVHVALGDDVFYGGTHRCAVHLDMVIRNATFLVDGRPLAREGRIVA